MVYQLVLRTGRKLELGEYGDPSGHPALFFHGLIGSHNQAAYISEEARRQGLRIIAPNRPGVGRSEFTERRTPLDVLPDAEDVVRSLGLERFSVIGISGGAAYALAVLHKLGPRVATTTVISGMGPMLLRGGLRGMDPRRRLFVEIGSRIPHLAVRFFQKASERFRDHPEAFLDRLVSTWSVADQTLFQRSDVYKLFLRDLHEVFTHGTGAADLAQQLTVYRNYGSFLKDLPAAGRITLWHGLADTIVPPAMTWQMAHALPNCEAHFVPGGHFVAVEIAERIISRLRHDLDHIERSKSASLPALDGS
jgi:pimeloyl-ACP methyl ester carboxylesterase